MPLGWGQSNTVTWFSPHPLILMLCHMHCDSRRTPSPTSVPPNLTSCHQTAVPPALPTTQYKESSKFWEASSTSGKWEGKVTQYQDQRTSDLGGPLQIPLSFPKLITLYNTLTYRSSYCYNNIIFVLWGSEWKFLQRTVLRIM